MIRSVILLLAAASAAPASVLYTITVNTASISATAGTIDFQFNPGDITSDLASAAISNFQLTGPGLLSGIPQYFGDASGTLPASLVVNNTANDNEALQALTFGTSVSFRVTLSQTLTGTALTGSVFNFGLFQTDGTTPLLTTDPSGFAATINLDTTGRPTSSVTTPLATVTATPEPGTTALLILGLFSLVVPARARWVRSPV